MFGTIKNLTSPNVLSMNNIGKEYLSVYSNTSEVDFKDVLQEKTNFASLDQIISELQEIKKNGTTLTDEYSQLSHCVNSLKNVLLLSSKIIQSIDSLNKIPRSEKDNEKVLYPTDIEIYRKGLPIAPCVYTYFDDLLITYFESLLMHSQALVDKLSIYVQKYKIYGSSDENLLFQDEIKEQIDAKTITNPSNFTATGRMKKNKYFYFSNMTDMIKQLHTNNPSDQVYNIINSEINNNILKIQDLIVSCGRKTLRNKVVHEESLITLSDNVFVAYRTDKGKIIKFDSPIIDDYPPFIESYERLLTSIPELAINIISALINEKYSKSLSVNNRLSFAWINTFIDYRKYIVESDSMDEKIKLNTFQLHQDGFTLQDFYYIKRKLFL
jgi:hypothetical protein